MNPINTSSSPKKQNLNSDKIIRELIKKNYTVEASIDEEKQCDLFLTKKIQNIPQNGTKIISIVGGAGSGKSGLTRRLLRQLPRSDSLSTDDYSVATRSERRKLEKKNPLLKYDFKLLYTKITAIQKLRPGQTVNVPRYDDKTGLAVSIGETHFPKKIGNIDYLIVEGDFHPVKKPDIIIYLHVPDEIRLRNRIGRDRSKRSQMDIAEIQTNFQLRQIIQHFPHTLPAAKLSDILIVVHPEHKADKLHYRYQIYQKLSP